MKNKIVRTFVIAKTLESMAAAWSISIYVLFLTSMGLSLLEANILNVVFMATSSVLDPFTGNLADKIGQKKVYLSGLFFWGVGMLAYGLNRTFVMFALAEAMAALGYALISEAMESWLRNHTDEETTRATLGKTQAWSRIATIPTAVAGGYIGSYFGLHWPWILASLSSLLTMILVWKMTRKIPERPDGWKDEEVRSVWAMVKEVWRHQQLRKVVIVYALVAATTMPFNMFWQPIFEELSGNASWLGWLWMGIAVTSAMGSKMSTKIKNGFRSLSVPMLLIAIPMALSGVHYHLWWVMATFMMHEIGRGMWPLVVFNYSNRHIAPEVRSTTNSIRSAAGTVGAAMGLLVSGLMTKWLSPIVVWQLFAAGLLIAVIWLRRQED